ncbi:UNVERIFIED_CONTAM: F-box/LRR-repeat protein 2 [Gekko kuhli]
MESSVILQRVTSLPQSALAGQAVSDDEALINKKLPKELLLRIFSFLDIITLCRCAQVSKSWNILALDGSNWQRIDLFNFQTDVENIHSEQAAYSKD